MHADKSRRMRQVTGVLAALWALIGINLSVFVLVSPAVLVFLWMISLSLKNELDNTAFPPVFIPNPPTFANYRNPFQPHPQWPAP